MVERRHYRSYLLRMWRVDPESCDWRAMLENPASGERQGFANLDELCDWIQTQAQGLHHRATRSDDHELD